MPTPDEIRAERERLYESPALRDDLNDAEATVLLEWADQQVQRLAVDAANDFEKQCRFLRQMVKAINRFVGQRQYNDRDGQQKYMDKVVMWLPQVTGFDHVTEPQLWDALPDDTADMSANLQAILGVLSPADDAEPEPPADEPTDASDTDDTPPAGVSDRDANLKAMQSALSPDNPPADDGDTPPTEAEAPDEPRAETAPDSLVGWAARAFSDLMQPESPADRQLSTHQGNGINPEPNSNKTDNNSTGDNLTDDEEE